jgi:hypothetical protein
LEIPFNLLILLINFVFSLGLRFRLIAVFPAWLG